MATQNRRMFVKQMAAGMAAVATAQRGFAAASPNEEVRVALIGCGVRSKAFYGRVSYVCDPDESRLQKAAEICGVKPEYAVTDFRRLLDDKSVDAVVIAAPDHWHAPAAILAADAGKHVYVEKPFSQNFREGQLLRDLSKRTKVVMQHGTQQRSSRFIGEAVQKLHEGLIGDVLVAKAWNIQMRSNIGFAEPSDPPPGVDYDMWVGPAAYVPFQKNRFHTTWHWWRNFGTGDIGNDGTHEMDYARWGLGVDTLPSSISAMGGKYFFDDQQEYPDTANCTFEYLGAGIDNRPKQLIFEMRLWSRNYPMNCDSGVEFYGTKGQMFLSKRGKLRVIDQDNKVILQERAEKNSQFTHFDNFLAAIRGEGPVVADLETAHRSVGLVHLANISLQVGRSLKFDPATEEIVGDDEASGLLKRKYREQGHWAVPKGV